jgi:arylsulfatase A-like enzyme
VIGPPARRLVSIASVLLAAACGGRPESGAPSVAAAPGVPSGPPPNVVVILVDALRADRLGAHGYPKPTSPAIDALAAAGVDFRAAFSPATWTKPSIASLFTGLHPTEHGLMHLGETEPDKVTAEALPRRLPVLAAAFRQGGWATVGVVNQVHLQERLGFARGFDDYVWRRGKNAFDLNRLFVDWLAKSDPAKPFFAYVHYLDAHWPYDERLAQEPVDRFGPIDFENRPPRGLKFVADWAEETMTPKDLAALSARYDHEIAYVDRAIGELVQALEASGRAENTIVVVTSDHGEGFFEHGMLKHSYAPYEEVSRVPMIVRLPARYAVAPGPRSTVVSVVDLAPTLLDLAGLPPLEGASGESLWPVVRGAEDPSRAVIVQSEEAWALRTATDKLIVRPDRLEHYDLTKDPGEKFNLAANGCQGRCAELREEFRRRRGQLRKPPAGKGETSELTGEDVEELKALGYL